MTNIFHRILRKINDGIFTEPVKKTPEDLREEFLGVFPKGEILSLDPFCAKYPISRFIFTYNDQWVVRWGYYGTPIRQDPSLSKLVTSLSLRLAFETRALKNARESRK